LAIAMSASVQRYRFRIAAWLAFCACMPVHAAAPNAAFDAAIDDAVARYHLPGIAVGVIENGNVVYVRTAGELVAGSGAPITPDSLFKIASNSKAMTSSVLARLVDAGKLKWDDPVVKHLPQFRMHDPWVTQNMQVRDLLVHNSGLPQGGGDLMLWPEPNAFTRVDIIHGLGYIKPAYGFRSGYAYDNLLYVVAGEVAAAAGGASYEELVHREIFQPLGLSRCRVGAFDRTQVGDVAQPHMHRDGRNVVIRGDDAIVPAITSAAAGGIRCSLGDMLTWARNWLAPTDEQLAWLSPAQRRIAWTPVTPMPIAQRRRDWDRTHSYAYALGWRVADVDGTWTVSHTGTLMGMYSVMTLLPDSKSGFVVLMNGEADEARTVLNEVLVKHFTDPGRVGSVADYAARIASEPRSQQAKKAPDTSARKPATGKALSAQLGRYRDPWFGEVSICGRDGVVRFSAAKSPMMKGQVMRVGRRYLVDWDDESVDAEAWLNFVDANANAATALKMAKVDPAADFSFDYEDLAFERIGDCVATVAPDLHGADLVDIASLVPDIALDIRYASDKNFVGAPIDGYHAPKCYLLRPAAEALQQVESALRERHLRLKLFDCYRPARAVRHFVRWAEDLDDQRTKSNYYPNLDKSELLGDYIAPVSGHSRGATADLTLLQCDADDRNCLPLDMGTDFDFFDTRANTDSTQVTATQRDNRELLLAAMKQQGFKNYPYEWWHFTLDPEPSKAIFDVPVQ